MQDADVIDERPICTNVSRPSRMNTNRCLQYSSETMAKERGALCNRPLPPLCAPPRDVINSALGLVRLPEHPNGYDVGYTLATRQNKRVLFSYTKGSLSDTPAYGNKYLDLTPLYLSLSLSLPHTHAHTQQNFPFLSRDEMNDHPEKKGQQKHHFGRMYLPGALRSQELRNGNANAISPKVLSLFHLAHGLGWLHGSLCTEFVFLTHPSPG